MAETQTDMWMRAMSDHLNEVNDALSAWFEEGSLVLLLGPDDR